MLLGYFSSKPMFPLFFKFPEKVVLDPNRLYKHVSDKFKKYLSVIFVEACNIS